GGLHLDASGYGGSFSANGQALNASTNAGKWGFFFSGARQGTDMRREPLLFDTLHNKVENFHNDGTDLFGFGKVQGPSRTERKRCRSNPFSWRPIRIIIVPS